LLAFITFFGWGDNRKRRKIALYIPEEKVKLLATGRRSCGPFRKSNFQIYELGNKSGVCRKITRNVLKVSRKTRKGSQS